MDLEFSPNSRKYKREQEEKFREETQKQKHPVVTTASKIEKKMTPLDSLANHLKTSLKLAGAKMYDEVILPGLIDLAYNAFEVVKNAILYDNRGVFTGKSSGRRAYDKAFKQQRSVVDIDDSDSPRLRKKTVDTFSIPDKQEAGEILDSLKDDIKTYGCATLYDYYCSLGVDDSDNDAENKNWGWIDLRGAYITRGPAGYTLVMPNTVRLSM